MKHAEDGETKHVVDWRELNAKDRMNGGGL
jgi:hypothetical protein